MTDSILIASMSRTSASLSSWNLVGVRFRIRARARLRARLRLRARGSRAYHWQKSYETPTLLTRVPMSRGSSLALRKAMTVGVSFEKSATA